MSTQMINKGHKALGSILEHFNKIDPVKLPGTIILTEADSNQMRDKLAAAIKFKNIDGDQDNSFYEGSDDKEIKLDDNGTYYGKGKTTIFNKDVDLKDPSKSTEQWMETPTGKVSDAKTEQVPNPQGVENLNESGTEASDLVDFTKGGSTFEEEPDEKTHNKIMANNHKESIAHQKELDKLGHKPSHSSQSNQAKVSGAIKNLFATVK